MLIVLSHHRFPGDDLEREVAAARGVDIHIHRTTVDLPTPLPTEWRRKADGVIHYPASIPIDGSPDDYPKVRAVMRSGVGFDNIDTRLWGGKGVAVMNVPDYGTSEVADHAIALMLSLARGTCVYHDALRADPTAGWTWQGAPLVRRLRNDVFGVVGLGRIGLAAAQRARAFGMQIAFHDPFLPRGFEIAVGARRCETLAELMSVADVVSVHVPGSDETAGLIDRKALAHAKTSAILVNTARGMVVDLDALHEALKAGRIGGAALDVLPVEPAERSHPLVAAFVAREPWTIGRLTLSPHAAFFSPDAARDMRTKAIEGMARFLESGDLAYCVNRQFLTGALDRSPAAPAPA